MRLGEIILENIGGGTPSKSNPNFWNGNIPWASVKDLDKDNIYFSSTIDSISIEGLDNSSSNLIPKNNIIVCTRMGLGKIAINKIDVAINQDLRAIILPNKIEKLYLIYFFKTLNLQGQGLTVKGLPVEELNNTYFPLPPTAEQHRIVQKIEELLPLVERYDQTEQKLTKLNDTFPEQLKKSVLQAAIQGKLTEQLPTDEPASELLKRIEAEKMRLISEGKLKKPKLRDNSQNAKFEPPFEIPQGWEWVRLGDLFEINPRNKLDGELTVSFIPMNFIEDGYKNAHTSQIRQWKEIKSGFTHFAENDLAVAKITPCFENRKSVIFQNLENKFGAGTTELFIFRSIGDIANINYLFWFVKSHYFINGGVKSYSGTAGQQRVSSDYIKNCLFPLPPLEEQKRIVEKVELLLSKIERL